MKNVPFLPTLLRNGDNYIMRRRLHTIIILIVIILGIAHKVNAQCSTWSPVGVLLTPQYPGTHPMGYTSVGPSPSMAVAPNGTPYVFSAFSVKKFAGGVWTPVGSAAELADADIPIFNQTVASAIAVDSAGAPYIVYISAGTTNLIVKKFNGSNWVTIGSSSLPTGARVPIIVIDRSGWIYVAYIKNSEHRAVVIKYNGTSWIGLGTLPATSPFQGLNLGIDHSGAPYISQTSGSSSASIMKFNGTSWVMIGGLTSYYPAAIDSNGTPYAIYQTAIGYAVKKFNGATWENVDSAGLAGVHSTLPSLAVDHGTVYFTYSDRLYGAYVGFADFSIGGAARVTVKKFNGSSWENAGNPRFSTDWAVGRTYFSPDGSPYIGYYSDYEDSGITVRKLNPETNTWDRLGGAGISDGGVYSAAITIDGSGTPYIAYADEVVSQAGMGEANVKKYNGSTWETVGKPGFRWAGGFLQGEDRLSIAVDPSNTPYVSFVDAGTTDSVVESAIMSNGPLYKGSMMKYNGSAWEMVGAPGFTGSMAQCAPQIAFSNSGTLYAAYEALGYDAVFEYIAPGVAVKKYESGGWVSVGSINFPDEPFVEPKPSIAINAAGEPYVVYTDYVTDDMWLSGATVRRYDGSNWVTVGSRAAIPVAEYTSRPSIAIDAGGTPYVVFDDDNHGGKASVMKFNGSNWELVGPAGFSAAEIATANIKLDGAGAPYVTYADKANGNKATVMKFNGIDWEPVSTGGFSEGGTAEPSIAISGNTIYTSYGDSAYGGYTPIVEGEYNSHHSGAKVMVKKAGIVNGISGMLRVCQGSTTTLSDATAGGTWSSSNTSVATVGSTGMVTGVADGTAIITYSTGGCPVFAMVTVNSSVSAGIITGTGLLCVSGATTLANATTGGIWSSNHTSIATVTGTGVVTGVSAGTATISYTVTNGCGSTSATMIVTVSSAAFTGTISGASSVIIDNSITLTDTVSGGAWSASNSNATVSSLGVVTGVLIGTLTISYTVTGSCGSASATKEITVNPAVGGITGSLSVCAGSTTTLSDATAGGTWSSSNTSVATVDSTGVVTGVADGTAIITYSIGSYFVFETVTVNSSVSAGTITGSSLLCISGTATLTDATAGGTWNSDNTSVASVTGMGVVTGVSAGAATISYMVTNGCGSASATMVVTVNGAPSAGTISGSSSVTVGSTITLSDTVTGGSWSASNSNASVSPSGVVTGVSAGTVTISYTVTNSCGSATATKVVAVNVSIGDISGSLSVCAGATTTLSNSTSGGAWASSNFAVATITSGGVVTGIAAGTANITYSLSGSFAVATVTVNPLPANISGSANVCLGATTTLTDVTGGGSWTSNNTSIATADASTGMISGAATGTTTITYMLGTGCYKTQPMTVKPLPAAITGAASMCISTTATYTDATTGGLSWSSSNTAVGTIGAASGILTGLSAGTTTVTFTLISGCTATKTVSVTALPALISGTMSACAGSTAMLTDGDAGGTWSSSVTSVATIGSTGTVTAIAAGVTNITYSTGAGCNRVAAFTVNALPAVITGTTTLCAGTTTALADATGGGTWASGTMTVAPISSTGIVTGISSGTSVITYTASTGCTRTATVTVSGSLGANTGSPVTCAGVTTALSNSTPGGSWSSGNIVVATVSATGIVTGVMAGTVNITYSIGSGCKAVTTVTVNASLPTITGPTSVCVGAGITLSNTVTGGTWSSSSPAYATVDAGGVVTGILAGTTTITYTSPAGCVRTLNITVKALPGAISGNAGICVGAASTLTDGSGTSWTSSTPSVATVGGVSGVVMGVTPGTSTITFTAANGCTATKVVTVDATPAIAAITGPSAVATGHTIALADATAGGVWSSNNTARATVSAGGVVTGVSVPAAIISYSVTNGVCVASVTKLITIVASRGEGQTLAALPTEILVYPNPTTGVFSISTPVAGTFTIYTMDGKEVQRNSINAGISQLTLPKDAAAGVYMCRFSGNDGSNVMVRLIHQP